MYFPTEQIAQRIEAMIATEQGKRKAFERRWYNNNFFDDGYHYRYVSRTTGRVVDLSTTSDTFIPYRAIPKASRQIRGVSNLILANEFRPVVYPENISSTDFQGNETGYKAAYEQAKMIAKRSGEWIENKWDELHMKQLTELMTILTAKHGISYLQVWPDRQTGDICAKVFDAFDIYAKGNVADINESPFLAKATPQSIAAIKANEEFDEEQLAKINPDNKYASSEIKEAYMIARFGTNRSDEQNATVILKECFLQDYITDENKDKIASDLGENYKGKKNGDRIIRQVFEAGGIWLKDTYLDTNTYPIVDYRMEPGPLYQVPLIERFIPANKSLDAVMSRLERHIGTMAVGAWYKRRGENYTFTNQAGGQVIEYDQSPPTQAVVAGLPGELFGFIRELNSIIEEQGATTSALGNAPAGVKSGVAIESLKASEASNLKIATDQLKDTIGRICEMMLGIASKNYTNPQTVYQMKDGKPDYFDVIGEQGMSKYKELAGKKGTTITVPNAIPLKKDYKVRIEVESGLGYTEEGKRNTMIQIITWMDTMAKNGYLTQEAVGIVVKRFLEIFQFGNVAEFMDALNVGLSPMTQEQINSVKVAFAEVIKDLQDRGGSTPSATSGAKPPSESINFKDLPPEGQVQMAAKAGIQLNPESVQRQAVVSTVAPARQQKQSHEADILKIKTGVAQAIADIQAKGGVK